jgi:hypothetical protein
MRFFSRAHQKEYGSKVTAHMMTYNFAREGDENTVDSNFLQIGFSSWAGIFFC